MFIVKDLLHWLSRFRFKLLVLFAAAAWGTVWVWPDSKLTLVFCSVGQGDASIISRGFTQVLIDAGPASPRRSSQSEGGPVADCLARHLPFFDRHLEAVIISHPQADHFAGLPAVLNRYQVAKFIFNGLAGDSQSWRQLSQAVAAEKSQIIVLAAGDRLKIGEIEIDVLWPEKSVISSQLSVIGLKSISYQSAGQQQTNRQPVNQKPKTENRKPITESILGAASGRDLNAAALVLKLNYGDFSALFTGDIGERQEKQILGIGLEAGFPASKPKPIFQSTTILKVPHHGSKTSSSAEFLEAVRPALAVIQVGKNSYGHPADEVIKRLEAVGARVLRTDKDGDVVVRTDGEKWWIKK